MPNRSLFHTSDVGNFLAARYTEGVRLNVSEGRPLHARSRVPTVEHSHGCFQIIYEQSHEAIAWAPIAADLRMRPRMRVFMQNANYLGLFYGDPQRPVRIPINDRRRHILITGTTGTGKSTLLANLFAQEANTGRGALLIDPHGRLAEQALDLVPPRRIRKTIYINPGDTEHPVGFNPLYNVPEQQRATRTANIVGAIEAIWGDISWGPKLQHVLSNAVRALLDIGDATLLGIARMIEDETYRDRVRRHITDPQVRKFWDITFYTYLEDGPQTFMSVLNKIEQITASPIMRNILGQPKSRFDPRHLMDNNYLVIINLSKGLLGDEHANLLGSLIISCFASAAMSRADLAAADCKDFAMIIDEFPNFTTNKLSSLLSEVRKYNVSLILAHQYLDQMSEPMRSAALGTVGSFIVFRVGGEDAKVFGLHMHDLPFEHFADTWNFRAQSRIMIYGTPTQTHEIHTPGDPVRHGSADKVVRTTRNNYAMPRPLVEGRITRFIEAQRRISRRHASSRKARF